MFWKESLKLFQLWKHKKLTSKVAYLWQFFCFVFLQPDCQNSPEINICAVLWIILFNDLWHYIWVSKEQHQQLRNAVCEVKQRQHCVEKEKYILKKNYFKNSCSHVCMFVASGFVLFLSFCIITVISTGKKMWKGYWWIQHS